MKTITFIIQALLAVILLSYITAAFLLTISQGKDGEPTIYNLIGLLMIGSLVFAYNRLKRSI